MANSKNIKASEGDRGDVDQALSRSPGRSGGNIKKSGRSTGSEGGDQIAGRKGSGSSRSASRAVDRVHYAITEGLEAVKRRGSRPANAKSGGNKRKPGVATRGRK